MSRQVTGIFTTRSEANDAIRSLLAEGVAREAISLLMSDATRHREFGGGRDPAEARPGAIAASSAEIDQLAVESVMLPLVGVFAAGPLVDALLEKVPSGHLTLEAALGVLQLGDDLAHRTAEAVQHGSMVLAVSTEFGEQTLVQTALDTMGLAIDARW
jgi:hypothetical protein